ncbi:MAG TPA: hypothetical protein VM619_05090 [Luteimonas sp.]|nr:hypothetical protein [Luteimonas sp.]
MDASTPLHPEPFAGWIRIVLSNRRAKWSLNIAFIVLAAIAAWSLGDLYDGWHPRATQAEQRFADRRAHQREAFREVQSQLQAVRGTVPPAGREELLGLQASIHALERHSSGLVQQLALAKRENDALRRQLERAEGPAGGYDFIVPEAGSMRIDATTVLGVAGVGNGGARVNLTSAGNGDVRDRFLASGQSLRYRAADGHACKVALLGTGPAPGGAAAFALGCE